MRTIDLDLWVNLSNTERDDLLKKINAPPSLFKLFIQVILKKIDGKKPPPLVDRTVFKTRRRIF